MYGRTKFANDYKEDQVDCSLPTLFPCDVLTCPDACCAMIADFTWCSRRAARASCSR